VTDLPGLCKAVLIDLTGPYCGLGTHPTTEGTAMRNAPLLEVAPDMVVPLGVFLLGERGVNLPRLVVGKSPGSGGAREVNGLLGKCFEARIRDLAVSTRPRHHVVT